MSGSSQTITCGICFKVLSKPLTFACHDTFCTECVRKQLNQNRDNGFVCPLCALPQVEVKLDSLGDFANQQLETYIKGLSDGKYGQLVCQWCEDAPATLQCAECMCTYCGACGEVAHKRPSKRNHVMAKVNESCRGFYRRCHQYRHEEYKAEFYCEECGEVCCAYCLQVGPHKDHRSTSVTRAATEARQQMAKDMQWLSQSKGKLETQAGELNRVTAVYSESYDVVEALVSERFSLFRQQLAQRELEVRRTLAQLRESGDAALTTARTQYLEQLNTVNEGLLRFRCLQSGGVDYDVLQSKALLDSCVHAELPTMTGTCFHLVNAGELALSGPNVQLDLQTTDLLRAAAAAATADSDDDAEESRRSPSRNGGDWGRAGARAPSETAPAGGVWGQPLRLTFPVDEDVEATVRPNGVFLRCVARGVGNGIQIGVRSKEVFEGIAKTHPEDGGLITWQLRLESVSESFLGIVEKTSRGVLPDGFYWKPTSAGVLDGRLGRQTPAALRLPVCRNGDRIRFLYDTNALTLRIVVNDRKDCGVVLTDVHPKVAACFIFYPGESVTVLF